MLREAESTSRGIPSKEYAVIRLGASALARAGIGRDDRATALLSEPEAIPGARENHYAMCLPAMVRARLVDGVEPRSPYAAHTLVAANAAMAEARGELQAPLRLTPSPRIGGSGSGSSPSRHSRSSARAVP